MDHYLRVTTEKFFLEASNEVERARKKFPDSRRSFAALVEEVGELARALLWVLEKPSSSNHAEIRAEAIQVAAMACRIATEGDTSLTEL